MAYELVVSEPFALPDAPERVYQVGEHIHDPDVMARVLKHHGMAGEHETKHWYGANVRKIVSAPHIRAALAPAADDAAKPPAQG